MPPKADTLATGRFQSLRPRRNGQSTVTSDKARTARLSGSASCGKIKSDRCSRTRTRRKRPRVSAMTARQPSGPCCSALSEGDPRDAPVVARAAIHDVGRAQVLYRESNRLEERDLLGCAAALAGSLENFA